MHLNRPPPNGSYLPLFVVVVIGVTIGNLLSNWIAAEIVEYKLQASAARAAETIRASGAEAKREAELRLRQSQAAEEAAKSQLREARRADKVGSQLSRTCADWTRANAEMNSYTTRTEKEKACSSLAQYIESGRIPR